MNMARTSTITYEQVAEAADALTKSGSKISSRAIREVLGGTGSLTTIVSLMQRWEAGQVRQSEAINDVLDPAIIKTLANYFASSVRQETAVITAKVVALQQEMKDVVGESEARAEELNLQVESLTKLQSQYSTLAVLNERIEKELVKTNESLATERQATELAKTELVKSAMRLEGLPKIETELALIRDQLLTEKSHSAILHEESAVAKANLNSAIEQRKLLDANISDLNKRVSKTENELNSEKLTSQSLQSQLAIANRDLATSTKEVDKQISETKRTQELLASVNKTVDEQRAKIAEQKKLMNDQAKEIADLKKLTPAAK